MKRFILIILIIIALLALCLNVYLKDKRPIKEMTGSSDNLVGIEQGWKWDWKLTDIDKLPAEPGVYVLWEEERVIHVGHSVNLRWHLSNHEKKKKITLFHWYQTRTKEEAEQLEKNLQRMFRYKGR